MKQVASAPTGRALDVVELLARSGEDRPRFSDVVRQLGLTQATAHAILATLCARGWAVRDPVDKTYSVGPVLAMVAASTDTARPLATAARTAAIQVSGELDCATSVVERVGESLVLTAFEGGGPQPAGAPGDRIRYAPPFGVGFAAWDSTAEQHAWVQRGNTTGNPELAQRLEQVLARTRQRGFDVDWTTPALTHAAHVVGTLPSDGLPTHVREITDQLLAEFATIGLLTEDDPARSARAVATIAAPVFDQRGHVAVLLAAHPLRPLTIHQVNRIGNRLTRAAAATGNGLR